MLHPISYQIIIKLIWSKEIQQSIRNAPQFHSTFLKVHLRWSMLHFIKQQKTHKQAMSRFLQVHSSAWHQLFLFFGQCNCLENYPIIFIQAKIQGGLDAVQSSSEYVRLLDSNSISSLNYNLIRLQEPFSFCFVSIKSYDRET